MKLMPPAKSVTLSIWKVAAIVKKMICMVTVTMALMAKWSWSRMSTAIFSRLVCSPCPGRIQEKQLKMHKQLKALDCPIYYLFIL
jgi:hypothetical protein